MITAIVFDFSRTLLFYNKEEYKGGLDKKHTELSKEENYTFLDHYTLNIELIDYIAQHKGEFQLYIFTNGNLHEVPGIKNILDRVFIRAIKSYEYALKKTDPTAYTVLSNAILNIPEEEIIFVDDRIDNIEAAKKAGLNTIHFQNNKQTISELSKLLNLE